MATRTYLVDAVIKISIQTGAEGIWGEPEASRVAGEAVSGVETGGASEVTSHTGLGGIVIKVPIHAFAVFVDRIELSEPSGVTSMAVRCVTTH